MSIIIQQCLENAIGLSETTCNCFDDDKPVDYSTSQSGLYLADYIGLNMLEASADCGTGSMWEILEKARKDAIIFTKGEINDALSRMVLPSRPFFNGNIADQNPKGYADPNGQYCGITWVTCGIPSGNMNITNIRLAINTTVTKTLYLYNDQQDDPLGSYAINCVANGYSNLNVSINLPMANTNGGPIRYWLVYDKTGIKPMNTTFTCGCGGSNNNIWNGRYEYQGPADASYKREYAWFEWVNVAGIHGNDPTIMDRWACSHTYSYGIQLGVKFECSLSDIICRNLDYENDPAAIKIASAILYKATELAVERMLKTGNINRYTTMQSEQMWGLRNQSRTKFKEAIYGDGLSAGAVNAMDITRTGCYKCRPGMSVHTI